jgi:hypothetical protein
VYWAIALLILAMSATVFGGDGGGYLFATFRGEQSPMTEQIYFATSQDGQSWTALHDGKPVLVSTIGEKGVRDPYLLRSHDGKTFFVIATDLSINLNHNWGRAVHAGSHSLIIWQSEDLVHWSDPWLAPVAPKDAGCAWAPEAVYDEEAGDYLVFWASTVASDHFKKHRIYASHTKDFKTFSEAKVYIERPVSVIDTTIIHDGNAYYRFSKDETFKAITMETAPHLAGPWKLISDFSLAKLLGVEGPECYPLKSTEPGKPPTWCLVVDQFATGGGYKPFVTADLASGKFDAAPGFKFPFHFRHGSILPVSAEELQRLQQAYGK